MAKRTPAPSAPRGRPSTYTDAVATTICERIASGESVRGICAEDGMPSEKVFYGWLFRNEDFGKKYAQACAARANHMAEEILALSDACREGVKVTVKADGSTETVSGDMVDRSRLQIETRKWLMAKLAPKKYGEKITQEVTGADGGPLSFEALVVEATRRRTQKAPE